MEKKNVLLVEGSDDVLTILGLLEANHIVANFEIKDCKGKDKLVQMFDSVLKNPSAYKTIGIVMDADENAASR